MLYSIGEVHKNMEKSIIFFDVDGTLFDETKIVPKTAKEAIFELKERGHEIAIATGRAPFMFEELRKDLSIDTYVSFNGQYVVVHGELIYKKPLNQSALEALATDATQLNFPMMHVDPYDMKISVPKHEYIDKSMDELKLTAKATHNPNFYKGREIFQSLLFCKEGEENYFREKYKEFRFLRWHPLSVDVDPVGGTKALGIEKVTEYLGIPKEQQYAFGDGLNDLEMLNHVPNSFAMADGHPRAKQAAKYITKPANEDGILYGLKMVGLL